MIGREDCLLSSFCVHLVCPLFVIWYSSGNYFNKLINGSIADHEQKWSFCLKLETGGRGSVCDAPRFGRQASRSELIWLHINFLCRICFYLECEINPKFFFAVEIKLIQANHISLETWPKCCVFDRTKEFPFFCELIT